jgi:hypothetical protein
LLATWEKALGRKRSTEGSYINLSGSNINFVMNNQSSSEYLSAFQIHTAKRSSVERRAEKRGFIKDDNIHLGGIDFLLVE